MENSISQMSISNMLILEKFMREINGDHFPYEIIKLIIEPFIELLKRIDYRHYYVEFYSGTDNDKCDALVDIWGRMRNVGQCIIFVNEIDSAYKLRTFLETELKGVSFGVFHKGLDRLTEDKIFEDFESGTCQYLISADSSSKGIDIRSVNFVINFDMPAESETYIDRIIRVGRYDRKSIVINFISYKRYSKIDEINRYINEVKILTDNLEDLL